MKLLTTILFLLLFQFSSAQSLELDYTPGISYGFNKSIFLEEVNPDLTNISGLSPMFSTTLRWNIKNDKNYLEFIYLKMRESLGARFTQGAGIRKNVVGSIDNAYVLSYGQNIKVFGVSILSASLGLGTEIVREKNRRANVTIGELGRYDYQVQNRLQPFLYGSLEKGFNWKRHHLRIKLLGRMGFKYNQFYYYLATGLDGSIYKMIVAKKGDAIALAVSYSYELFRFKKE